MNKIFVFGFLFLIFFGIILVKTENSSLITFHAINLLEEEIVSVFEGMEIDYGDKKYSNYGSVITSTEANIKCKWKISEEDNGYKICEAIFEVEDTGKDGLKIKSPIVSLEFEDEKNIRNLEISFSTDYQLIQEERIVVENTGEGRLVQVNKFLTSNSVDSDGGEKKPRIKKEIRDKPSEHKLNFVKKEFQDFYLLEGLSKKVTGKTVEKEIEIEVNYSENSSVEELSNIIEGENNSFILDNSSADSNISFTEENLSLDNLSIIDESEDFSVESEEINYSFNSMGENNSFENKRSILTGLVTKLFEGSEIDTSKPFAVKVRFELLKYEGNQFNFSIQDSSFEAKIDPTISSCGELEESGSYYLDQDLVSDGTCLSITGNNILLDCNGNAITFGETIDQSYGIVSTAENTTITNCTILKGDTEGLEGYGIFAYGANNLSILDNTLQIFGSDSSGIKIINSSNSNISYNNILTSNSYSYGIIVSGESNNTNISSNLIETEGESSILIHLDQTNKIFIGLNELISGNNMSHGIYVDSSDENTICGNSFDLSGLNLVGIYSLYSQQNILSLNLISTLGEENYGIFMDSSENNSVVENNISVDGRLSIGYYETESLNNNIQRNLINANEESYGIMLELSEEAYLEENILSTSEIYSHGIFMEGANNNFITETNIVTTGEQAMGVYSDDSSYNNTFVNLNINTYGEGSSALYIGYLDENLSIIDGVLNSNYLSEPEIYFYSGGSNGGVGTLNLTNVSFDREYWRVDSEYDILRNWYVEVLARFSNGSVIPNATIQISNETGFLIRETETNDEGETEKIILNQYTQVGEINRTYSGNYTISLSYGDESNETQVNLTSNLNLEIFLPNIVEEASPSSSDSGRSSSGGGEASSTSKDNSSRNEKGDVKEKFFDSKNSNMRESLFDISLDILDNEVNSDAKTILVKVFLLNIGLPQKVNATLNYTVVDKYGGVVSRKSEEILVETQKEFLEKIDISELVDGEYAIIADLNYPGQIERANSRATFRKGELSSLANALRLVTLPIVILVLIFLVIFKRKKSRPLRALERELDGLNNLDLIQRMKFYSRVRKEYEGLNSLEKKGIHDRILRVFGFSKS